MRVNAAVIAALPEKARAELNSISDSYVHFRESLHMESHPWLEQRVENINQQKQLHDKGGLKR
jgi:hypothetical protein